MSRPKRTPFERACEAVAAIPRPRREALYARLTAIGADMVAAEKTYRGDARTYPPKTRLVAAAQRLADEGRDLGKLLALLKAVEPSS